MAASISWMIYFSIRAIDCIPVLADFRFHNLFTFRNSDKLWLKEGISHKYM